jgi:hypothetical protein
MGALERMFVPQSLSHPRGASRRLGAADLSGAGLSWPFRQSVQR